MAELTLEEKLAKASKIMNSLNAAKAKKNPDDTRPAVYFAGQRPDLLDHGVLKSANIAVNEILHGGLKRGTVTIVWGLPGCGKSCLAYETIAQVQRDGGVAVILHAETMFPIETARMFGIDLSKLIIIQNFINAEIAMDSLFDLLSDDKGVPLNIVDLVVVDSVASMPPKAEVEKVNEEGFESCDMALLARLMSKFSRITNVSIGKAAMLLINQVRSNIGGYGAPQMMPGGHALNHLGDAIIYLSAPKGADNIITEGTGKEKIVVGHTVHMRMDKNKAGLGGHPGQTGSYVVRYNVGTDTITPLYNSAVVYGLVYEAAKSRYRFNIPKDLLSRYGFWKLEINEKTGEVKTDEPMSIHGEAAVKKAIETCEGIQDYLRFIILDGKTADEALELVNDKVIEQTPYLQEIME
jgi:RecA/RadA recombinase